MVLSVELIFEKKECGKPPTVTVTHQGSGGATSRQTGSSTHRQLNHRQLSHRQLNHRQLNHRQPNPNHRQPTDLQKWL